MERERAAKKEKLGGWGGGEGSLSQYSHIYAYQLSSDCVTFKQTHFLIKPTCLCYPGVLLMDSEFISWCFRHFGIIYF